MLKRLSLFRGISLKDGAHSLPVQRGSASLSAGQFPAPRWPWRRGPAADKLAEQDLVCEMVRELIENEGVREPRVLEAMRRIPRHAFVPSRLRSMAYEDCALPIGHRQTITGPFVVAMIAESLGLQAADRVLEVGTGSGYQAAVLSRLVERVYSIEIVRPLGKAAKKRLKRLSCVNVTTKIGDGYLGWPEHAPFDKIVLACSPEIVPQPLIDQLREGGRMILPLGQQHEQKLILFEKRRGALVRSELMPTYFVPMTGCSDNDRSQRIDVPKPQIGNGDFALREDDGSASGWYEQRQLTLVPNASDGTVLARFDNDQPGRRAQALQTMAIDGRRIGFLTFTLRVSAEAVVDGPQQLDKAGLQVVFDNLNGTLRQAIVPVHCVGTFDWATFTATVKVPKRAREALVRIGLNGATGRLFVGRIKLFSRSRFHRQRSVLERWNRRMIAGNIRKSFRHLRQGEPLKALRILRFLAKCAPSHPAVQLSLAGAAFHVGNGQVASTALHSALSRTSRKPAVICRAARLQFAMGDRAGARDSLDSARDLFPTSSIVWRTLGIVQGECSEGVEGVVSLRRAIETAETTDDRIQALFALGEYFDQNRHKDDANSVYRQILEFAPAHPLCHARLADSQRDAESAVERADLLRSLLSSPGPSLARRHLHYALGRLYDREGRAAEAFAHFHLGNELRARSAPPFNLHRLGLEVDGRIEIFDSAFISKLMDRDSQDESLIFVVGMPRSGTTLVEQILGSHSAIRALGEREDLFRLTRALRWELKSRKEYPSCAEKLSRPLVHKLAESLRERRRQDAGPCERIVTKLPEDFWDLGLIAILFPKARIVHCRRHPIDTCLSCYMQNFEAIGWATSLDWLVEVYRLYRRIMEHWRSVLPSPGMFEIEYEDLVARPEEVVRQLCDFVALPFEEGCLRFYERAQRVDTASRWQVRNPIYDTSVGRWKRYREFLGPLLELDEALPNSCDNAIHPESHNPGQWNDPALNQTDQAETHGIGGNHGAH